MGGIVACFAGKIGSGKTSVTNALAHCLTWRRVGFGDYVRVELARRGGNPELRSELQDLGQYLAESSPAALCRGILSLGRFSPGGNLLVDGVRHAAVYQVLGEMVKPSRTYLLYLRANDDLRGLRAADRGKVISTREESHLAEADLAKILPNMADAMLDSSGSLKDVVYRCVDALGTCGVETQLLMACKKYAETLVPGCPEIEPTIRQTDGSDSGLSS